MATENKFKKGDWVRCIDNGGATGLLKIGAVYKVDRVNDVYIFIDGIGGMTKWRFEPWQPKVGERVRVPASANSVWAGEGEVIRVPKWCAIIKMLTGGMKGEEGGFMLSEIEPVTDTLPVAEQPAARENAGGGFKAGDKIELVQGEIDGVREIGDVYEAVAHQKPAHKDSVCHLDKDGKVTWAPGSFFKLHEPLTIQAGRFYKTRDGRKVGPMAMTATGAGTDRWRGKIGNGESFWHDNGAHWSGRESDTDLVAEWVDTPAKPTTNLAATVDAINDEYGPVVREVPVAPQQARFKVGDRLKMTGTGYTFDGSFVTVKQVNVNGESDLYRVLVENHSDAGSRPWAVREQYLEIVKSAVSAIVCKIDHGQPLPATRPAVHATVESADAEAKRLANLHTGQEFGVYALTGTPHKVAKVYEHEWQRLADQGRRADAEKELRRITGMSHSLARHVVSHRAA